MSSVVCLCLARSYAYNNSYYMPMGKVVNDVKNLKSQSYTFTIYNIFMVLLDQCFRMKKKRRDSHGVKWCLVASNSYSRLSLNYVFFVPYLHETKVSIYPANKIFFN